VEYQGLGLTGWSELFGSRTMVQELLAKQKAF